LSVVWIKAHVGHEGNEEADRLAKLGTTNGEKHIQVGTPQAEIKSDISKYVRNLWDEEWQTYSEGKHTKEFYTHNDKNKAKALLTLSRFELSRFVGLVTGHGNLAYFYSKLEPGSNPICRFCRERNETFIHFIECPRLRTYQTDCFLDKEISQGWEVEKVLEFSYKRGINEAVEGIEDNENNYSIFSVSSSEDSFVYSQPEPD